MSILKNKKFYMCLILAFVSLLIFGCENKTPVEDISFREDEIVLLVGESYTPNVSVTPSYATDSSYTLTSNNSAVVAINGNSILAVSEGNTTIRVRSNDNNLIEDVMTVIVRKNKATLDTPRNLTYNATTQTFTFDNVNNATSYTIRINGHEINLGNSNTYSLSQYDLEFGNAFDTVLTVQVMANAPTYSQAFINSAFSSELIIYQNSPVVSASITNGTLTFEKNSNSTNYSILINGDEFTRGTSNVIDLTKIPDVYVGNNVTVGIVSLVNDDVKTRNGNNVVYYDSISYDIDAAVLDVTDIAMTMSTISWNNVNNASSYSIYIDNERVANTINNYFDLKTLADFEDIIYKDAGYLIRVEPEIGVNSVNVLKSEMLSEELSFNRFDMPNLSASGNLISWQAVEHANSYAIEITYDEMIVRTTSISNSFSLDNYPAGTNYTFKIYVEGQTFGDVNYLSSPVASIQINKKSDVELSIVDYVLTFNSQIGDSYKIEFNTIDDTISETIEADSDVFEFDLSTYSFMAGQNEVVVTHLGDNSTAFDSNATTIQFIQLESIDDIEITNGVAKVNVSEINESAEIRFAITGEKGTNIQISGNEVSLNSQDSSLENYLQSDNYTIAVYVYGDGQNTFSVGGKVATICASKPFVVLDVPSVSLLDKDSASLTISDVLGAEKFNIYTLTDDEYILTEELIQNNYDFTLNNGEMSIKIQTVGDGTNYLNSVLSDEIKIIRLSTPLLSYDSTTDIITRTDSNPSEYVKNFTFKFNNVENDYAFDNSPFTEFVVGENILTLKANAVDSSSNIFYLNSFEYQLTIDMIDNSTDITIDGNNRLVITPKNQDIEYNINLIITIDEEMSFEGDGGVLTCGDDTLNYIYEDGSYYIDLLNTDYTPIIAEMNKNFNVRVKFISDSTGEDSTANSAFTADKSITLLTKTTAGREGQYITISNIVQTNTYVNYGLLINNIYCLNLDGSTVVDSDNQLLKVDVNYIYQNTPIENLSDINEVAVITLNVDSSIETPTLSVVGDSIKIARVELPELTASKDNTSDDNSVKISFKTNDTDFDKTYVVEIYNLVDGEKSNTVEVRYSDTDAVANTITFNLDGYTLTGEIYISYYILTSGEYISDGDTVYVFNSDTSNELKFTKIDTVSNIIVSGGFVTFDAVEKAVGYEIYKETASGYQKVNTGLLTTTSYNLANETGNIKLYIKAISADNGYTNANLSEVVNVNKLATPVFSVENGMIVLTLSQDAVTLLEAGTVDCTIHIINGSKEYYLNIDSEDVTLNNDKLYIEPYLVLGYGVSSLLKENLVININVNYVDSEQMIYYLNSNSISVEVYGLFAPSNTQKYTSQEDDREIIEHISWVGSQNNMLDGVDVGYGYILRIQVGDNVYYSSDTRLKFIDSDDETILNTYPSILQDVNVIFPYGYDADGDGVISETEKFLAGEYHISVKALPKTQSGYNLLSSAYSVDYVVYIMETPYLDASQGSIIWQVDEQATSYVVRIYDSDFTTEIDREVITETKFDFSNEKFNSYFGLYGISVQSISTRENVLNSETSEIMQVFRMPEIDSVTVDDGSLVIHANRYFNEAEIQFVDSAANRTESLIYSRAEDAANQLTALGITKWGDLQEDNVTQLYTVNKYIVEISESDILNILVNRSYSINIRLKGNSNRSLCVMNSIQTINVSELIGTKLNTNIFEVSKGILQFNSTDDYESVDLNYNFNNQDILDENSFWNDTIVYKLTITTPTSYVIYAVDYYRFLDAISNSKLSSDEYALMDESLSNLYAYVKFNYTDEDGAKTLYFNVFKDNSINLKDYNILYYYSIDVTVENGEFIYTGAESERAYSTIDLSNGGSFVIRVNMLGGDSIISRDTGSQAITSHTAYLTANTNTSNTFIRYSENVLTSYLGKIKLNNQSPVDESDMVIDYPLYELTITKLNTVDSQIVYLYYNTEEEARQIVDSPDAIYVKVTFDELNAILFDMSECLDDTGNYIFSSGSYEISVRTIAGLGNSTLENASDYLLNSKAPTNSYIYNKISDTSVYAENGVLKFALSSINSNNTTIYIYDYEITIIDDTGTPHTYQITRDSEGISMDSANHIVTYELPSSIDINGEILNIEDAKEYSIKVKGLAQSNQYVLNGSFIKDNAVDREFEFSKSTGISTTSGEDLRIEDGVLKWKVLDITNYTTVTIQITFLDSNQERKTITFTTTGTRENDSYGTYQYHYYSFLDDRYRLDDGTGTTYIDYGTIYSIKLYVAGTTNSEQAVLNSNYSNEIEIERLNRVDDAQLLSINGNLSWNSVENVTNYIVTLTSSTNSYVFTTTTNSIDFSVTTDDTGKSLEAGTYSVNIRAMGDEQINSRLTNSSHSFIKLSPVENIGVDSGNLNRIRWDINEDAQGYWVKFTYNTSDGVSTEYEETITGSENNSIQAPTGMTGQYTVQVRAMGIGYGYVFNSESSSYTSSKDRPNPVGAVLYDNEQYRYYWTTASDFGEGDRLRITYNFRPYIQASSGIELSSDIQSVVVNYSYNQAGTYFIQDSIKYYYYAPTVMGQITSFMVQVEREGSLYSATSRGEDITMNIYSIGSGTAEDPYGLDSVDELMEIGHFANANFKLLSAISFAQTNISDLIEEKGAIVCETFSGTLDGNGYAIYGFGNIQLSNINQFALFSNLNGATIKNIVFGESTVDTIITNTFANTNSDMVNLALIANNANNATIENITTHNVKFVLAGSGRLSSNVYVGGLLGEATDTTISGSILEIEVQFDVDFTSSSYIGGIIGYATTSTINSSSDRETELTFTITQAKTNRTFTYIGGAIGYLIGDDSRSSGIFEATVDVSFNNIYASNLGGLIGFMSRATVQESTVNGNITHTGISNSTNIGAVAGTSQSGIISQNNINLTFDIGITNASSTIYIGAVAGRLTTTGSLDCQVLDCVIAYEFVDCTVLSSTDIQSIGIYGYSSQTNVIVSGCTQRS